MPDFTIETTYHLPVFRHRTYSAETLEAACRAAIADDDWDNSKKDYDSCGEIHVTGIWEGADTAYARPPIQIPSQFEEAVIRRAYHFEILFDDVRAARPPALDWLARTARAIARGEAILAGDPDPEEPVDLPKHSHVLIRLQEDGLREAITAVLEVDPSFKAVQPEAATDDEVQAACVSIATTMDFSNAVGSAEFQAALSAIRSAQRRLASD